jgi:hypothetical protein
VLETPLRPARWFNELKPKEFVMASSFVAPVNILEVLDGADFPATLPELIAFAEDNEASEEVLDQIQAMEDREYESIQDVNRHLNVLAIEEGEENIYSSAAGYGDVRHEPAANDDVNIERAGHQLKNWAASGNGDLPS